jgi:hypothetical protein
MFLTLSAIHIQVWVLVQVIAFNGEKILHLQHLVDLISNCKENFFEFELSHQQVIVLDANEARKSTLSVLKMHNIPKQMSKDIKAPVRMGKRSRPKKLDVNG